MAKRVRESFVRDSTAAEVLWRSCAYFVPSPPPSDGLLSLPSALLEARSRSRKNDSTKRRWPGKGEFGLFAELGAGDLAGGALLEDLTMDRVLAIAIGEGSGVSRGRPRGAQKGRGVG
ncbi:hypothetical protein [Polyangium aurulentum]|uniref:hypothetical protein n=1 Tax=Polyangium aurulentum TaxID=2567896 RepID=UPI0010ADDF11|nr:hypothetical protein [Polyangium aurulentum]UQA63444.1 hypothetical protein E8A73_024410 [Polyangium aurulentum]